MQSLLWLPLLAPLLAPAAGQDPPPAADEPDDAALLDAWAELARSKSKKKQVVKTLRAKVDALDTFQLELVRELCEKAGKPAKAGEPVYFDPKEHVKNQPVRRKALKPDDERFLQMVRILEQGRDPRTLRGAYSYDWLARKVVQSGDPEDPDLLFHNALHGYPPGLDLARAQALAQLDGGQEEKLMTGFAHAYTDREGGLYPGITLYDVWLSGRTIEMPDIDALGLMHTIQGDWKTWTDPVPAERHDSLYDKLGELFTATRRYREPRESLADNLLIADPVPREGYDSLHGNFQALWEKHGSDVGALAAELPDSAGWQAYIEAWVKLCKSGGGGWEEGLARAERLTESGRAVRAALVEALREEGALE